MSQEVLLLIASALGLAGAALLATRSARPTPVTWVPTRDGLARFRADQIALVPWAAVAGVELRGDGVVVRIVDLPPAELHPLAPSAGVDRPRGEVVAPASALGDLSPSAFRDRVRAVLVHPEAARSLPGFRDPEGPPESVLAGLPPAPGTLGGEAPPMSTFASDLATLTAPLDPTAHADELGRLRACKSVADLERLAANDGGWLSTRKTDPRLKLVRHGTGTFLVVRYDDGWSSTVSQAPFRKR